MNRAIVGSGILIIALACAVYGNSLHGAFIWDDIPVIRDNPDIRSPAGAKDIFTKSLGAAYGLKGSFYRPLYVFTYSLNYLFSTLDVRAIHLTNIAVHILTALTLFWLITVLFGDRTLSLCTAIFFVVHPAHTEAVSYMAGRVDPLVTLFILLSLIWYVKIRQDKEKIFYILFSVSYAAALLCKENALILPALMLICRPTVPKQKTGKWNAFTIVIVISFLYIAARLKILGEAPSQIQALASPLDRLPGFFAAIAEYIRILIAPIGLHMEYGNPRFSFIDPRVISGLLLTGVLLFFAVRNRKTRPIESLGILWFFIALVPVSNLYPLPFFMAEHYLYLPSIGFFLLLASWCANFYKRKQHAVYAAIVAIGIAGSFGFLTVRQNGYWADPIRFYERTLHFAPDSARIYNNLANCYRDIGQNEKARALYKKALEINPKRADVFYNLGIACHAVGRAEEAIDAYEKAARIDPGDAAILINLSDAYRQAGRMQDAIGVLKKAIVVDPGSAISYNNLGLLYYIENDYILARRYLDKARQLGHAVNRDIMNGLEMSGEKK